MFDVVLATTYRSQIAVYPTAKKPERTESRERDRPRLGVGDVHVVPRCGLLAACRFAGYARYDRLYVHPTRPHAVAPLARPCGCGSPRAGPLTLTDRARSSNARRDLSSVV